MPRTQAYNHKRHQQLGIGRVPSRHPFPRLDGLAKGRQVQVLDHLGDQAYRMLGRNQIIQAARHPLHLATLRGPQPNRRLAPRRRCLALRLGRGDFFSSRRQLLHPQLCIIIINNVSHVGIISYINELASENFALGVKYLWKTSKKVTSSERSEGSALALFSAQILQMLRCAQHDRFKFFTPSEPFRKSGRQSRRSSLIRSRVWTALRLATRSSNRKHKS